MRFTPTVAGVTALLATAPVTVGQSFSAPSSSIRSNFSLTSIRPSASPTPTGSFCCDIFAIGVGLNFWWNRTATAYTATVITRYIEYDNTVSSELATITNVNATTGQIPTDIIGSGNEYRRTTIATQTAATYETTIIASPTPHLAYNALAYMTGTWSIGTQGTSECIVKEAPTNIAALPTTYVCVEDPPVTRTDGAFLPPPPSDIMQSAVSQNPTLLEEVPFFTECEIVTGTGQPTVHIPVTALTSHSSTTIRRTGDAPVSTTTSKDVSTPTTTTREVPSSTTNNDSAPTPTKTETPELPPPDTESAEPTEPTAPGTTAPGGEPDESTTISTTQVTRPSNPTSVASTAPGNPVTPPSPENTQPPAGPVSSSPPPTDGASPPAVPVAPNNEPDLPFPIVPVPIPVPTATNADDSPTTTVNPGAVILPGNQTLNPGQQTTISNVVISVPTLQPTRSGASPSVVVVNGQTTMVDSAPAPIVVVDGTTHTVPAAAPAPTQAAAVPITLGSQVLTVQAPTASGEGVVLPNSETLAIGATTTYGGETLVVSVVTSSTAVATVVEVADESTTQSVTLPSAATPTGFASSSGTGRASTTAGGDLPEYTGGAGSLINEVRAWSLVNAMAALLFVIA